jgi:hypothetical protein
LPELPVMLKTIYYDNNPITDILDSLNETSLKDSVRLLNKFRYLYYCLKLKIKFIRWFLKANEEKIIEKNHPNKIAALLNNGIDIDDLEKYL